MNAPALSVRELQVSVRSGDGATTVIDGISFELLKGEVLAMFESSTR